MTTKELTNNFINKINKYSHLYECDDDFEYINKLVNIYMNKGMEITNEFDKLVFCYNNYVFTFRILLEHGYKFKNIIILFDFFESLSFVLPYSKEEHDNNKNNNKTIQAYKLLELEEGKK
jgi:hypothetical protein